MHPDVVGGLGDAEVQVVRQAGHHRVGTGQRLAQGGAVADVERHAGERQVAVLAAVVGDDSEAGIGQQGGDEFADLAQADDPDLVDRACHVVILSWGTCSFGDLLV